MCLCVGDQLQVIRILGRHLALVSAGGRGGDLRKPGRGAVRKGARPHLFFVDALLLRLTETLSKEYGPSESSAASAVFDQSHPIRAARDQKPEKQDQMPQQQGSFGSLSAQFWTVEVADATSAS